VVADAFVTADGHWVSNPAAVPAGGRERFLLYGSALVRVTASGDGSSSGGASTTLLRCG
jgi:hypothetical protein